MWTFNRMNFSVRPWSLKCVLKPQTLELLCQLEVEHWGEKSVWFFMWSRGLSSLCARHSRICLSATVFQPLELPLLSSWRFLEGNAIASRVVMTGTSQVAASVADFSTAGTLKRKQEKKVGTHNGTFHCDEALGCFMIRLTEKFAGAEIVRTRDQKVCIPAHSCT